MANDEGEATASHRGRGRRGRPVQAPKPAKWAWKHVDNEDDPLPPTTFDPDGEGSGTARRVRSPPKSCRIRATSSISFSHRCYATPLRSRPTFAGRSGQPTSQLLWWTPSPTTPTSVSTSSFPCYSAGDLQVAVGRHGMEGEWPFRSANCAEDHVILVLLRPKARAPFQRQH